MIVKTVLAVLLAGFALACSGTKNGDQQKVRVNDPDVRKNRNYRNMVLVPAGDFLMSTGSTEQNRRKVTLKAFYIDLYETSNEEYARFIADGGYSNTRWWSADGWAWRQSTGTLMPRWWKSGRYRIGPAHPKYPVGGISWYEADAFARWAGKRLPTEAEWEKASRGTDGRLFPWGNDPIETGGKYHANFESLQDGHIYAAPVDAYPESIGPFGCYNMVGNVWEWVMDSGSADRSFYRTMPEANPLNSARTGFKLLRGGSWYRGASMYDSFFRLTLEPSALQYDDTGFRCAADAD